MYVSEHFIELIIGLMFVHWVGDFVLQSTWMAINKSKKPIALFAHVGTYSLPLFAWALWALNSPAAITLFMIMNVALHFFIDAMTSSVNSRLWERKDFHWFFVMVGFDQFLHFLTLIMTMNFVMFSPYLIGLDPQCISCSIFLLWSLLPLF